MRSFPSAPEGAPNVQLTPINPMTPGTFSEGDTVRPEVAAEAEIRTILSRYSLCGEGLCIGYDGGDAVSSEYTPKFEFTGGRIVKVVFDVAEDAYVDLERHMAAAMARD
jgi:hypothetical protein